MDTVPHGSFHCDVCEISYYSWNCVLLSQYFLSGLSWKIRHYRKVGIWYPGSFFNNIITFFE